MLSKSVHFHHPLPWRAVVGERGREIVHYADDAEKNVQNNLLILMAYSVFLGKELTHFFGGQRTKYE